MAVTPASIAAPSPRRSHSPAPIERFIAAYTLPPSNRATAREVAAPKAYANSSKVLPMLAPCSAAPVNTSPRMGPAHGAQSRPVATPISNEAPGRGRASAPAACDRRLPAATNGRVQRSARLGSSNASPNSATNSNASQRPY
ncbi:hypothetical protein D3C73_1344980 [compost metagenome]